MGLRSQCDSITLPRIMYCIYVCFSFPGCFSLLSQHHHIAVFFICLALILHWRQSATLYFTMVMSEKMYSIFIKHFAPQTSLPFSRHSIWNSLHSLLLLQALQTIHISSEDWCTSQFDAVLLCHILQSTVERQLGKWKKCTHRARAREQEQDSRGRSMPLLLNNNNNTSGVSYHHQLEVSCLED